MTTQRTWKNGMTSAYLAAGETARLVAQAGFGIMTWILDAVPAHDRG